MTGGWAFFASVLHLHFLQFLHLSIYLTWMHFILFRRHFSRLCVKIFIHLWPWTCEHFLNINQKLLVDFTGYFVGEWGDRIWHHCFDWQEWIYRELFQWPVVSAVHHHRGGAGYEVSAKDKKGNQGNHWPQGSSRSRGREFKGLNHLSFPCNSKSFIIIVLTSPAWKKGLALPNKERRIGCCLQNEICLSLFGLLKLKVNRCDLSVHYQKYDSISYVLY